MEKPYIQQSGKIITDSAFKHVMAITLDPRSNHEIGIIRCITSRSGDLLHKGNVDRSVLHKIHKNSNGTFSIGEQLKIKNEEEIIKKITPKENFDFIGLEDPDIWVENEIMHVYFTIPFIPADPKVKLEIYLGHAVGKDLDSLEMTMPVLMQDALGGAKEVSIAPINSKGVRLNLVESAHGTRVATAKDMNGPWEFGDFAFDPKDHHIPWIGKDASPGPLFSREFIDVGEDKLLGIINGREKNDSTGKYRIFSVGLFIYNYEEGKIEWVSPEPFIRDTEAEIITFASQLVEHGDGTATLYAHVDDSFVRAYTLNAKAIKLLI